MMIHESVAIIIMTLVLRRRLFSTVVISSFYSSLILVVFGLQGVRCASQVIYVTPGDESLCPNNASQCHTLGWYVRNTNGSFIVNNTEVRFLEGMHTLNTSIRIENYHNITIVGVGSTTQTRDIKGVPKPSSWIHCNSENSGFVFLKSNEINITNLGFHFCGTLAKLCSKTVSAALFFHQGNNILLYQVLLNESRGVGLHLNNIYGSVTIHDSAFMMTSPAAAAPRGDHQYVLYRGILKVYEKHNNIRWSTFRTIKLVLFIDFFIVSLIWGVLYRRYR